MRLLVSTLAILATAGLLSSPPVDAAELVKGKTFDRFMVVILENTDKATAQKLPFLGSLNKRGGVALTNYNAVAHPSQPNYIAMISGGKNGVLLDNDATIKDKKTIVDLLEAKGISWKAYMEEYRGGCDKTSRVGDYVRKHNPFISFTTITSNPARCSKIVPATEFDTDIQSNNVPQFIFYTPNMQHDGHDSSPQVADTWLQTFLEPKLNNADFMKDTAILITYDEAENYFSRNQVFSVLIGGAVQRQAATDNQAYSHYSVLKTIEDNWGLDNLGQNDVGATPFILKESSVNTKPESGTLLRGGQ